MRIWLTPETAASELGCKPVRTQVELRALREAVPDIEARRSVLEALGEVDPVAALALAAPGVPVEPLLSFIDRGLQIYPSPHGEGATVIAMGQRGLEALAASPVLAAHTNELRVERIDEEDSDAFFALADSARFPALAHLRINSQDDLADAAIGMVGPRMVGFHYVARGFRAAHARKLLALPLRHVGIFRARKDEVLPLLSHQGLESLELSFCPFSHKHLKELARLPALRHLRLVMHGLSKASVKSLARLVELESLDVSGNDTVDDASWAELAALGKLRRLVIRDNKVGVKTAKALAGLPLEVLDLTDTDLRDSACRWLGTIPTLRELHMGFSEVSKKGFAALAALPKLERLEAEGATGNGAPAALAPLTTLRRLSLAGSAMKAPDVAALGKLSGLTVLDIEGNEGLASGAWDKLGALALRGLDVSECGLGNNGLEALSAISTLEWLAVKRNAIDDLSALDRLRALRWLHGGENPVPGSAPALSSLKKLFELDLYDCRLDSGVARTLAPLSTLRRLSLYENRLDDDAVDALASMKQLWMINLVDNRLSADGEARLRAALPLCEVAI